MKRLCLTICVLVLLLSAASTATANTWQVVYQTDFSSDPGWITNEPSRYYWNSSDQTFFANQFNINGGGCYAYRSVTHRGEDSFRLEWDMIVNSIDYAAALSFGLYASDLQADAPPANYAQVILGSEDRGLVAFLAWANPTTYSGGGAAHFSLNTWYHIVMEYDAAVHTLKADIAIRDTGQHFATLSATNVGPFATDMGCLGSSNVRSGNFQCPGNQSFGKFDNIILSQPPTPAGSIVAWGDNSYGQCNQPPGGPNTGFVEVAAGCWHSLGLKQDGSIVAWGDNSFHQCDVPSPNTGFVKVAAIDVHSLGLKQDGSIVVWGSNWFGEGIQPPNTPNTGFVDIAAGQWHNLGLKSDGSVVAWGRNYENQCDVPPPNTGFVSIAAGNYHSLGLKSDGSIVAWGYNEGSQLNIPSPNSNFIAIDGGYLHSLGLKNDGSIVAWGSNYFNFPDGNYAGQCNVPLPNTGFVKVAAGLFHSLGLKMDGSIVGWGDNSYRQATPPTGNNYIAISAGWLHSLAIIEPGAKPQNVYHVDAVNGNDNNDGLTRRTAFATIQKGADSARNGFKVLVYPGVYQEEVDFKGKAITVQGVATRDGIPIIENPGDFAVSFYNGEGPRAILKNFVIEKSFMAIFIAGSSPTIKNLTVLDNKYGVEAYVGSEPDISNCIFWENTDSDLFGCEARYSFVQQDIEPNALRGLVACWSFDENSRNIVPDKSGNGHNGTIYGATWTQGIAGTGLCFDGLNDYVDVPDDGGLSLTDAVTVSAWIWLDPDWLPGGHGGAGAIVCKHNDVEGRGYALRVLKDRRLRALLQGLNFDSQSKLNLGQWTHVAFTLDPSNGMVSLYINGNKEGRGAIVGSLTSSGCELRIGDQSCYPGGTGTEAFYGVIDEALIYNTALTSREIQQLSRGGLPSNPLFADPNNGDYHLLSQRGRYWPRPDVWVLDKVTSSCIDGGDPYDDPSDEPMPNGGRIDMGAYGGTPFAGMSEIKWLDGDINHDGIVNLIDLAMLAENWLTGDNQ